jgi:hypothetical protein
VFFLKKKRRGRIPLAVASGGGEGRKRLRFCMRHISEELKLQNELLKQKQGGGLHLQMPYRFTCKSPLGFK